ncbi:MAG: aldehyde dehydrogenase (NADP(+)) [Opitutae bacterium]|nr:aldehyde dehydrogenase (NADP(+)) [Opitutae bacterium]
MKPEGASLVGFGSGSPDGAIFRAFDPALNTSIEPVFISATLADADRAAQLATAAAPMWAALSGAERNLFLRLIADKLAQHAAVLAARATQETAIPLARCEGEIGRTVGQLRLYGDAAESGDWLDARIETAIPDRKPIPKPDHRSMMRPLGPVVVFGASNFPFAYSVAGGDTASALAAGCPVIVKAHPAHPGTSDLVGRLIVEAVKECGLPEGTFSLLFDAGIEIGQALVKHPLVKAVGFTGSLRGGRALADAAAARPEPIPVYAEMGSVNPVFILPGALAERSAALAGGLHASAMLGVGQFCTNPGLIVLQRTGAAAEFIRALTAKLAATAEATMLTPGITASFRKALDIRSRIPGVRTVGAALRRDESGHSSVAKAMADKKAPPTANCSAPVWFETDAVTFVRNHTLGEEIFGPSSLVVWCKDAAEMREVARHVEGSLTATLHAGKSEEAQPGDLVAILAAKAGRLVLNGFPTGVDVGHAMVHGGPYPATSDGGRSTSVGTRALTRWGRLICYQNFSENLLPPELQSANPRGVRRLVNGEWTIAAL